MTVAIYSRVSTRDKGQETENQIRQLTEYCKKQDWTIVQVFEDQLSGKTADRDAFQRMFEAASRREFDLVLFWSLDRFSREGVLATLQHLERLTSYGVGYKSFTEQYLDSVGIFRDAIVGILATIARQERVRLSERTIAGLERARAKGRKGGRPRIVCNRDKVVALHRDGHSLGAIAGKLSLTKSTVARIIKTVKADVSSVVA